MLLKHTPSAVVERTALSINPAKTCMPIGAMYAALGIHACLPHSHGSQGCCAYHRSMLTRHFREPVMAATSSFTEGSSVFGGQANLLAAIENIFTIYNPEVIAVHTTCLSETIGDDINQIIAKAQGDGKIPEGKSVFHANTPSYVGSHVTGFARMTKAMVDYFSEHDGNRTEAINLIPGWVEPSDIRELKRLVAEMNLECIVFPDQSDVFDTPQTGKLHMYPKGGVTIPQIKATGNSVATIGLGPTASGAGRRGAWRPSARCPASCSSCPSACGQPTASSPPCGTSTAATSPTRSPRSEAGCSTSSPTCTSTSTASASPSSATPISSSH